MSLKKKQRKTIKTQAVFVKNNQVFFKKTKRDKKSTEEWSPVLFQWIGV